MQVPSFHIDPSCGCNFVKSQEWRPDNWSTLVEQTQQQMIQGYEMISLHLPCHQRFQIPHKNNPKVLNLYQYYFRNIYALFPYILTSFFEKYQWIFWKLFFDDRSYPIQEASPCYILLKDMPTIQSIDVNHHIEIGLTPLL